MEDQWLKSNTDCVYYLASPLTCKKGIECEYRHSETARLNPIDCWYWLAGNCLNSECAFRHPPFDGPDDGSLESANLYQQHDTSSKTTNVPCHFFFSGFCNKGEMCSFSHGLSSNASQHSQKAIPAVPSKPIIEKKINNIGSDAPAPTVNVPFQKAGINIKQITPMINTQKIANLPSSDEKPLHRSHPPLLPTKERRSHTSTDKSSSDNNLTSDSEELFDSSPGFDVQVNDISEKFSCEDYPNGFQSEINQGMKYMGYPYEEMHSKPHPENRLGVHYRLGKRTSEFQLSNERNFNCSPHDRSMNDDYEDSFLRNSQSEERYQQLQRRLGPKAVRNRLQSRVVDDKISFIRNNSNHQNRHVNQSEHHFSGRRQGFKRLSSEDYLVLKRPQEFSLGREAKRRYPNGIATVEKEFQGPKSLSEILREKKMVT